MEQDKIRVTELPVGFWTEDFKELLSDLQNDKDKEGKKIAPVVKDVFENYTDTTVEFVVTFSKGKLAELEAAKGDHGCNGLEKALKLYTTSSTTNMNLFDADDKLRKYDKVEEIIDDYYGIRIHYYEDRKEFMIEKLDKELLVLSNKARYIQEVLDGTIDLRKKKRNEIVELLNEKEYDVVDDDEDFKYLVRMPMDAVSEENVEKLLNERKSKQTDLDRIKATTIQQMWLSELEILEEEYVLYKQYREQAQIGDVKTSKKKKVVSGPKKTIKKELVEV
jgi:DNA topoisomerase-2